MLLAFVNLASGELDDSGKGILAEGQRLAATLGMGWSAICFGPVPDAALEAMRPFGPAEVLELGAREGLLALPGGQAEALAAAAEQTCADVVLLAHDDLGGTLAPELAEWLSAALFTEAVSFSRDWAGLTLRRQAVGTQLVDQRIWIRGEAEGDLAAGAPRDGARRSGSKGAQRLVLTMLPRVLSTAVLPHMKPGAAKRVLLPPPGAPSRRSFRVLERFPPDPETVDVAEASVIFTAGLGCDRPSFDLMCELARRVGASVGVTRPVYDLGFRGYDRMIGQTGKTVVPRLYVTFGISGSMHHVGGITESKRIVCINTDAKAPIFPNADEGFVADVRELLPRLLERVKAVTG